MALDYEKANRQEKVRLAPNEAEPDVALWWVPSRGGRCFICGNETAKGSKVAFASLDRTIYCEVCAEDSGLTTRPSRAWLRRHRG